ncbi:hypothetical protein CC2G_004558 [Coprinopsis cinerea AmutBmut pab1-1]|nr:hypothetical protein CC2G_004558 [Coprinopsis cinerea AmutBmut pab1-1]
MATLASHDAYFRAREDTAIQLPMNVTRPHLVNPRDVVSRAKHGPTCPAFGDSCRHVFLNPPFRLSGCGYWVTGAQGTLVRTIPGQSLVAVDKSKFNGCRGPQGLSKRTRAPTFIFHPSLMYSGMPYSETATHLHLRLWLLAQPNTSIFLAHMSSVGFHNPPSSIFQTSNPGSTRLASFTEGNPPFAYREALGSRSNPMGVAVRHEIVPQGSSKNPAGLPNQTGITALHLRKDHGKKQAPA